MQITKCDRCGKTDEFADAYALGMDEFHIGSIRLHKYLGQEQMPSIEYLDLCCKCQGKLDEFVNKFMEGTRDASS